MGASPSKATVVIPARYESVRFPGKALVARTGKPLVQHVFERAAQAASVDRVLVATDDRRIADAVRGFGGEAVMTRADHPNGTSRIAEAAERLDAELIVNVQGDEPEIDPALIDLAVQRLQQDDECPMGTLASPFAADEDPSSPHIVKVVIDRRGRALYFSRALIPYPRTAEASASLKHVGLYIYRRTFLPLYVKLAPTPLEQTEHLEQLRVLEHGYPMAVAVGATSHHGIDTPEQYEQFLARYRRSRVPSA